jgi:DNA-binding transcriptional regulator YhcF (GntR family)
MKEKPNYYAIIPAEVRYSNLKPNAKLLYGEITALSNKTGYCFASNNYFAELYGVSKNTVSRWIADLKRLGFITIEIERAANKQIIKRCLGIVQKVDNPIDEKVTVNITFEIKLRLLRWAKNQKNWDKPKPTMSKIDSQINEYLKGKEYL